MAADVGARVAVIVLRNGRDRRQVSRHGPLAVIRLAGERRRGWAGNYLLEYLGFLWRVYVLIRRDVRFRHARVFHIHTLPDFLIGATRPARRIGARLILDLHEVFPEFTRSKFGGWPGAAGAWVAGWLERWSRRQADVTVTVNTAIAERLGQRPARAGERITVIHNFADPAEFGPPRTPQATPGRARLVYHGTLTGLYGLDLAVAAVAQVRSRGIETTFDIWGDGPERDALLRQIETAGLGEVVRLRGTLPHHELREVLTGYDAGFVPTRLDVMTRFSLSTKLLEYVHLGVPVVIPRIPTYVRYLPEHVAWYFVPGSVEDAAGSLEAFAKAGAEERVARASAAQEAYAARINPARDAGVLRAIYTELLTPA